MITFLYFFSIGVFIFLCILLCFVVLIQESKATGLGAAFGGEASESVFGTSTADVLKKFTGWLACIFFVSCLLLSIWTTGMARSKNVVISPVEIEQSESN